MNFIMNNRNWKILEKTQNEMKNYMGCNEKEAFYFGLCLRQEQEIWLCNELCEEQKKQTLLHELTHCYITCYISMQMDMLTDEQLCDICANSHYILHDIVKNYFKLKKEQD